VQNNTPHLCKIMLGKLGRKGLVGTHRCTVRYEGSVQGHDGLWYGLEWDDPTRGRHDGSVDGTSYFKCIQSVNAGSFVRAEKVRFGCSVLEALFSRYSNERGELGDVLDEDLYVHTVSQRRVHIQVSENVQHTHTHTHTHTNTHTHTHTMIHTNTRTHTYTHNDTHTNTHTHIHALVCVLLMYVCKHAHSNLPLYTHTQAYTHIHTQTHAHTHTHIHTHAHIHTRACVHAPNVCV